MTGIICYNPGLPSLWEPRRGRSWWGKRTGACLSERFTELRWRVSFAVAAVPTQAADWLTGPRLTECIMVVHPD
ncbi:hypothetical protein F01_50026 [Burkholderia cenocepacia]|nr:hypothetical protein F01_50026 [Burkholderia cenocepacia]